MGFGRLTASCTRRVKARPRPGVWGGNPFLDAVFPNASSVRDDGLREVGQ
jgi:hypothetical protein